MNTHARTAVTLALTFALAALIALPAAAQDTSHDPIARPSEMEHNTGVHDHTGHHARATPHSKPSSGAMGTQPLQHLHFGQMIGKRPEPGGLAGDMEGASMHAMDMSSMQGGSAPPDARSGDYSDGYAYGTMPGRHLHGESRQFMLLLDQLEFAYSHNGDNAAVIDGQGWYGGDIDKLWLEVEGEHAGGRWEALRSELLWSHAVAAYWDTQLGVRHDSGEGPGRTWAAFGVQGLAPYWFETDAAFYVGQDGRAAARLEFEYEALLTQHLILHPKLEVNLYGKDDPRRGIGSGLSDLEAGLRLRYEIRREFAPYVGVVWRQTFGRTADYARMQGRHADDLQFVAGFRIWF